MGEGFATLDCKALASVRYPASRIWPVPSRTPVRRCLSIAWYCLKANTSDGVSSSSSVCSLMDRGSFERCPVFTAASHYSKRKSRHKPRYSKRANEGTSRAIRNADPGRGCGLPPMDHASRSFFSSFAPAHATTQRLVSAIKKIITARTNSKPYREE